MRADDKVFWWYAQHENALAETHGKAFTEFVLGDQRIQTAMVAILLFWAGHLTN